MKLVFIFLIVFILLLIIGLTLFFLLRKSGDDKETYTCDIYDGTKAPSNYGCPTGYKCKFDGTCIKYFANMSCETGIDCPLGMFCTRGKKCIERRFNNSCSSNNDCVAPINCVEGKCKVECTSNLECLGGKICDILTDYTCKNCTSSDQCEKEYKCNPLKGLCEKI